MGEKALSFQRSFSGLWANSLVVEGQHVQFGSSSLDLYEGFDRVRMARGWDGPDGYEIWVGSNRIVGPIDEAQMVTLRGNVHSLARGEFDAGVVSAESTLKRMGLELEPSPALEAELDELVEAQHDPASPLYHRWLTPAEYGARFGASAPDLARHGAAGGARICGRGDCGERAAADVFKDGGDGGSHAVGGTKVTVNLLGGLRAAAALTVSRAPGGVTAVFSKTGFAAPGNGSAALTF